MIRRLALAGFCLMLVTPLMSGVARAELPDYVLDKDYQSCIADGRDPARNAYCACIRENMRGWSDQDYMDAATAAKTAITSPKLEAVAKQCLASTIH